MRFPCLSLLVVLAACGGSGGPTNGGTNGVTNFTAKIDGADWNAEFPPTAVNPQAGMYVISGVRSTSGTVYTMAITLHNIAGTGTHPLGVNLQVFGGHVVLSDATSGWSTTLDGDAGFINITALTATRIAATFEFVADPLSGTGATRTVTQGQFDVTFTGTVAGVAAANRGSSFTGNVPGAYTAAQVTHVLSAGGTPSLTVIAQNPHRGVTISLANMTGPATYTLSGSAPVRTIFVGGTSTDPFAVWRSDTPGGSGSVTIASVTADRILGSFSATVAAGGGSAAGTLTVSGSFNLGRGGP